MSRRRQGGWRRSTDARAPGPPELGDRSGATAPLDGTGTPIAGRSRTCNRYDKEGSVLLLVPAGVLVLIILGAIAVDLAIAFLGQRELSSLAAAVANDAATAAISDERFYRGAGGGDDGSGAGDIEIDPVAAQRLAQDAADRRAPRGLSNIEVDARAEGRQVCVRLRGDVAYVFARAVPGAADKTTVEGSAVATAVEGDAGAPAGPRSTC
ncbi:MAG TPA: hypothetical protein VNA57_14330 [Acidimicrobiales bacterium]|nr:hypothetical protein [Acidimicrobiales bacterium]